MKILILASNPRKDLNLDREIRDLRAVIESSRQRQAFQVEDALAVRVGDLQDLLFRHRPHIVHFCGHGSGQQGLVFEGNDGGEQWVRADALSDLFRLFSDAVNCVLLNACYSEEQASAIVDHIDYVVGMNQAIQDDAAIAFSKGFYRALGYDCSVEQAFEFGKNAIQLEISGSSKMRSAATEAARKAEVEEAIEQTEIPEHLKPILKIRPALIAAKVSTAPEQPISQETRVAIQVEIDQSLESNAEQQYRDKVREFLADHELTRFEQIRLEQLQKNLGLSAELAAQILAEEQQPIQRARDDYQEMLIRLIEAGEYPFNAKTEAALQQYCQELQLTQDEVEAIRRPILVAAEECYQLEVQQRQIEEGQRKFLRVSSLQIAWLLKQIRGSIKAGQTTWLLKQIVEARQREESKRPIQKQFRFQTLQLNVVQRQEFPDIEITYQLGLADYFAEDLGNGLALEMVAISGGTFMMGQTEGEKQELLQQVGNKQYRKYFVRELPQHWVTVPSFWMGKFAITQAQYQAIVGEDPACFKGENRPVEKVTWHDAVQFCDQLNRKTGRPYRLPSEAEWEYACRAGTITPFYCGETITTNLANYNGNSTYGLGPKGVYQKQTTDVGNFPPNSFGLYDMHGNVWEWCADHWHENYEGVPTDGSAWITGGDSGYRLLRGGSWDTYPRSCRSTSRGQISPGLKYYDVGFRVVFPAA
jgi:formylglycine-generating enzyme required for sulfatase activity